MEQNITSKCIFFTFYVFRNIFSAWRTDPTCTLETQRYPVTFIQQLSQYVHCETRLSGKCVRICLHLSQLASNISSFAVCNDFLLITTHSHTCRCLQVNTLGVKGRMETHRHNITWVRFMSNSLLFQLLQNSIVKTVAANISCVVSWPLADRLQVMITRWCLWCCRWYTLWCSWVKWPSTPQGCRRLWPQMEVRMTRRCGGWREDPGSSLWSHKTPEWFCRSVKHTLHRCVAAFHSFLCEHHTSAANSHF